MTGNAMHHAPAAEPFSVVDMLSGEHFDLARARAQPRRHHAD